MLRSNSDVTGTAATARPSSGSPCTMAARNSPSGVRTSAPGSRRFDGIAPRRASPETAVRDPPDSMRSTSPGNSCDASAWNRSSSARRCAAGASRACHSRGLAIDSSRPTSSRNSVRTA